MKPDTGKLELGSFDGKEKYHCIQPAFGLHILKVRQARRTPSLRDSDMTDVWMLGGTVMAPQRKGRILVMLCLYYTTPYFETLAVSGERK